MKRRDLFDDLSPIERKAVLAKCSMQQFRKGEHLYAQNSPFTFAYLVCSGAVRVFYLSPNGNEITTGFWSTGALIGGPKLFREHTPES